MNVFVEQRFECVYPSGGRANCCVLLFAPEPDGPDFKCVAEVQGGCARGPFASYGGDRFQALILTIASLVQWMRIQEDNGVQFFLENETTDGRKYSIGLWSTAFLVPNPRGKTSS